MERNEDFEVIQLDDYNYELGLNFLDRIQIVLFPWVDQIHIVTGPLSKIVVPVNRDMKVGTKVLSSIQLVKDISHGRNINSIKKMLRKPLRKRALSKFLSKEADGLWAVRSQDVRIQGILMGTSLN
ncbi:hypothetical protein Gogos_000797 [Gossypium gossypioides]|uniref:Uncharacterized protein n=1 Tax=Gossypium gossypioides TaxID=34282 RepID=A0A7J9CTS2_GOSGO|nr:hypothetical protein [Gossypium gossypioides]